MRSRSLGIRSRLVTAAAGSGSPTLQDAAVLLLGWLDRARQRRHLARLDDRLLRDIGLDRATAARETRKPFWQR